MDRRLKSFNTLTVSRNLVAKALKFINDLDDSHISWENTISSKCKLRIEDRFLDDIWILSKE